MDVFRINNGLISNFLLLEERCLLYENRFKFRKLHGNKFLQPVDFLTKNEQTQGKYHTL